MPLRQARVKTEKPFENLAPGSLSSQTASQGDACVAGFGAIALSQALTATAPSSILLHNRKTHIRQCVDRDEYWPIPGSRESGSRLEVRSSGRPGKPPASASPNGALSAQ